MSPTEGNSVKYRGIALMRTHTLVDPQPVSQLLALCLVVEAWSGPRLGLPAQPNGCERARGRGLRSSTSCKTARSLMLERWFSCNSCWPLFKLSTCRISDLSCTTILKTVRCTPFTSFRSFRLDPILSYNLSMFEKSTSQQVKNRPPFTAIAQAVITIVMLSPL